MATLTVVSSTDMKSACTAYHVKGLALLGSLYLHFYKLALYTVSVVIFAAYSVNGESISLCMYM